MSPLLLLPLLTACSGGKDGPDDTADSGETAETGESADTADTGETAESGESDSETAVDTAIPDMPPDPRPLTVTVSGATSLDLVFDTPSCTWYDGIPNFRAFWRGSDHAYVLIAEIISVYDGPGTYDPSMGRVGVKLQEEAHGTGAFFQAEPESGDEIAVTVEYAGATQAFGSFDVSGLHGDGAITLSPSTLPIWCPSMN